MCSLSARQYRPRSSGAFWPRPHRRGLFACWALKTDGHDLDHARRLRGDRVDTAEGLDRLGRPDDGEGYLVTLDQSALDRLRARRRRGESYSDVIVRLAEASRGA